MILEFEKYRTDLEALRAKLHDVSAYRPYAAGIDRAA